MKKKYLSAIIASLDLPTGDLPEWYLIFAKGQIEIEGEGLVLVDEKAFDLVKAGVDRRGVEVVFDYEHQTVGDQKAPASGWVKDWRWTERGIEAKVDWTEEAAGFLAKKEYRYFSPVFYVGKKDGRLCGVHSVALTNTPKTNKLKPLLAKLGAEQKETDMDLLKMLIAALDLDANADEQAVVAKVKALADENGKEDNSAILAKLGTALGVDGNADESTIIASVNALKQGEKMMVSKADFDALQAKIVARDANDVVAAALKIGKITPDQKDWAIKYAKDDPTGFDTFVAKAPVVVPVNGLPASGEIPTGDVSPEEMVVAKQMGVDVADLKAYKTA